MRLWGERPNLLTRVLGPTPSDRFLSGLLTQNPDAQTARFVELFARSWTRAFEQPAAGAPQLPDLASLDAADPSRLGYYYVPDATDPSRRLLLVRVYPNRAYDSLTAIAETVDAIRAAAREAAAVAAGRSPINAYKRASIKHGRRARVG